MSFLKKLFSGRRARPGQEGDSHLLAKELESCIAEAERLVASGRHEEALQVAEGGLRRFPGAARLRSVVQYVKKASANKRLAQLKTALETRKDERAYRELVQLNLDLGRVDAAQETAQRYVREFPDAAEAHVAVGEVALARYFGELFSRDAWASIESLQRAVELNAATLRAHLLLGTLYFAIGAQRAAAQELGEVLRLDSANPRAAELRDELLSRGGDADEDIEQLLDQAQESQTIPNDPSVFPGGRRFSREGRGGTLSPKLFASAATGIGRKLRIEQLAAIATGGRPLAVAGENKESFVRLACRIDTASRRAGRHMNFGTMQRFMVEGKFGRIVLVPAGNCAVAARAPRSVPTERIAEGLEMVITASRAEQEEA